MLIGLTSMATSLMYGVRKGSVARGRAGSDRLRTICGNELRLVFSVHMRPE